MQSFPGPEDLHETLNDVVLTLSDRKTNILEFKNMYFFNPMAVNLSIVINNNDLTSYFFFLINEISSNGFRAIESF